MKRSILYLVLSLLSLVAVLSGYGMFYGVVSALSGEVAALRAEIAVRNVVSNSTTAPVDSAALIAAKQQVASFFVDPDNIADFLGGLQSIGTTTGARVAVVSVAEDKKSNGRLTVTLQAVGSFDAAMRTVGAIEYSPYDLTVSNLVLSTQSKSDDKAVLAAWTASMTVSVGTVTAQQAAVPTQIQP
jgi:hypothetical protein